MHHSLTKELTKVKSSLNVLRESCFLDFKSIIFFPPDSYIRTLVPTLWQTLVLKLQHKSKEINQADKPPRRPDAAHQAPHKLDRSNQQTPVRLQKNGFRK